MKQGPKKYQRQKLKRKQYVKHNNKKKNNIKTEQRAIKKKEK